MITQTTPKRVMDIVIAVPLLIIAAPICLILLLAIRIESRGSPLFMQTRVGYSQRPFRMYKLRTMATGTANVASHHVSSASITRLGGILRRLKLDELPQLFNVVCGSMSLVGPRPCLPNQHDLIREREARGLYRIRPGVTGPAQSQGIDMSEPLRLAEIEAEYFQRARLIDDLRLIARTVSGGGRGDAATVNN